MAEAVSQSPQTTPNHPSQTDQFIGEIQAVTDRRILSRKFYPRLARMAMHLSQEDVQRVAEVLDQQSAMLTSRRAIQAHRPDQPLEVPEWYDEHLQSEPGFQEPVGSQPRYQARGSYDYCSRDLASGASAEAAADERIQQIHTQQSNQ